MPTKPISKPTPNEIPVVQNIVSVLWPSFLTATMATVIFFTLFDPQDLGRLLDLPALSSIAGYTGGFFGFWLLASVSSTLTCYFRRPCNKPGSKGSHDVEQ